MNRKQITRNITQLGESPALSIVPPMLNKSGAAVEFFRDADLERARMYFKRGLAELKITAAEFPTVKYNYSTAESHYKIALALQQQWFEVLGVTVEIEKIDKKILMQLLKTRNYQIAQSFLVAQYHDPMSILERFKYKSNVKNYPNWQNAAYMKS